MHTIKINIEQTPQGYEFCNGNIAVAQINEIKPDRYRNFSRFALYVASKPYSSVDSLAMAVEIISDKLEALFGSLGLNVEFNK
ncbi:MAG: hypothetical protein K2K45_04430 [Muribaculaceae bacterium]|nr:hypothetical protein [Muribaculaceae bacterium]